MATKKMAKKPKPERKRYPAEFRAQVLARCKEPGCSAASVANDLGLPVSSIYAWMAAAKKQSGALTVPGVDEQRELELLRRENKRLAKDCEILRCAVAPIL
jgi:transposase-like protein